MQVASQKPFLVAEHAARALAGHLAVRPRHHLVEDVLDQHRVLRAHARCIDELELGRGRPIPGCITAGREHEQAQVDDEARTMAARVRHAVLLPSAECTGEANDATPRPGECLQVASPSVRGAFRVHGWRFAARRGAFVGS